MNATTSRQLLRSALKSLNQRQRSTVISFLTQRPWVARQIASQSTLSTPSPPVSTPEWYGHRKIITREENFEEEVISDRERLARRIRNFVLRLSALLILAGEWMLLNGSKDVLTTAHESLGWTTVAEGTVISNHEDTSAVLDVLRTDDKINLRYPVLHYNVNGEDYYTKLFSIKYIWENSEWLNQYLVNNYRVGTRTKVFVDPNDPSHAVVEPGLPPTFWQNLAFHGALAFGIIVPLPPVQSVLLWVYVAAATAVCLKGIQKDEKMKLVSYKKLTDQNVTV